MLAAFALIARRTARRAIDRECVAGPGRADPRMPWSPSIRPRAARAPPGRHYYLRQRQHQFHPFVLVVPVGANVSFPNFDPTRHHVYSFSPAKRFELKLFARDQSRSVRFDKPGVVALGCNIHDQMSAFIDVVDTPGPRRPSARAW